MSEFQNVWVPHIYQPREGDYAKIAGTVSRDRLIELVRTRIEEDGTSSIENGHVGENNENEEIMRKMMIWAGDPRNIIQCYEANPSETVDWICRDLANAAKWIGGSDD